MAATFTTVGRIVTGWGCLHELGALSAGLGRRALLVTGRSALRSAGTTGRINEVLSCGGVEAVLFEEVDPEPGVETVDRARAAMRQGGCDLVVAVGGGSAIDVGKAAAALAGESAATGCFFDRPLPAKAAACVAVPTTAGTGAEVTSNSVLCDSAGRVKQSIRGPSLMPELAIVDAELTVSCPPDVTAAAGMDALTQAIESYWSRGATHVTDALALHAVDLVWTNLLAAYQNGQDRPAREALACGSLLAGMALANARLGAVHGIAHPVGVRYHVRHGVVCAVLLPHVMRFNRPSATRKYEALTGLLGADAAGVAAWLLRALHLPQRLSDLGASRKDFDAIAVDAIPSGSTKANPRQVVAEDIRAILEDAF